MMNLLVSFALSFILANLFRFETFSGSYVNNKQLQGYLTTKWPTLFQNSYECFKVFWNVPSHICGTQLGINIELKPFGIRVNMDQNFFGDEINIFYEGDGLLWPHIDATGTVINGGIPQLGNLNEYLRAFEIQVNQKIPNPAFSGPAIIDFEYYTPLWATLSGSQNIYKNLSLEYARRFLGMLDAAPDNPDVLKFAQSSFETATRIFMEQSLLYGRTLRPLAKWGFYGFPTCSKTQFELKECPYTEQINNNNLLWLYMASDALYPSIYIYKAAFQDESQYVLWILKIFRETTRITQIINALRRKIMKPLLEVYPYYRYEYADTTPTTQFLSDLDNRASILGAKLFGFNGLIIWGSSTGMNLKCPLLRDLLNQYLGQLIYYAIRCYV